MGIRHFLLLVVLLLMAGCSAAPLPPVAVMQPSHQINYQKEVHPILVKRCVVCHSCYNSPCQLKLESFEGLDRGASKEAVYNAERLKTMDPTRLFTDAQNTGEWRNKGFVSVTSNTAAPGFNDSIMLQLLNHKKTNSMHTGDEFKPEEDKPTCSKSSAELGGFLEKHPNRGMPYGFPPLSDDDFNIIAGWLLQGAAGPGDDERARLMAIPAADQKSLAKWEEFLNQQDEKHILTARYLYEHLFLAHITFNTGSKTFYELVRSRTPPSEKDIKQIATVLPYDDPGPAPFYYRFRKIHSTIVHKTHMVFPLSDAQFKRVNELFIDAPWPGYRDLPGYDAATSANPFKTYAGIPPASRYRFLLDNIHYIIGTFIRGPVCKGQVALNVVHDHFWLVFLDPAYDLSVQDPKFLEDFDGLLQMPDVETNLAGLLSSTITREYRKKSSAFTHARQQRYAETYQAEGMTADAIWPGERKSDTPLLTVFRHFDSASVHAGPLGNLPKTIWVMDYPLVERIYYSLVAGFNVFGHKFHQLATRIYMDELRQEGETYFVDFMPKAIRNQMMSEWYGGMDLRSVKLDYLPSPLETGFSFKTCEPKREFVEYLVEHHFLKDIGMRFDANYLRACQCYPAMPQQFLTKDDYIKGFLAVSRPGTPFFSKVHDHNANLAYVRIIKDEQKPAEDVYLSIVVNRWHDDVTTLFGEEERLRPQLDSAVFIDRMIGSYPNYFFEVKVADLPRFFKMLKSYDGSAASLAELDTFGVNRAHPKFWEAYDRFQQRFNEDDPEEAGLFDLNRYHYLARLPQ